MARILFSLLPLLVPALIACSGDSATAPFLELEPQFAKPVVAQVDEDLRGCEFDDFHQWWNCGTDQNTLVVSVQSSITGNPVERGTFVFEECLGIQFGTRTGASACDQPPNRRGKVKWTVVHKVTVDPANLGVGSYDFTMSASQRGGVRWHFNPQGSGVSKVEGSTFDLSGDAPSS